jgi:hypothetical protein
MLCFDNSVSLDGRVDVSRSELPVFIWTISSNFHSQSVIGGLFTAFCISFGEIVLFENNSILWG